jgi:hypothetical protein
MAIEIRDVRDGLGVMITATGFLSEEEYLDSLRQHLTQDREKFKRYRYSLSDFSDLTGFEIRTSAVRTVADLCRSAARVNPDMVVAVVAAQDAAFGLSRMWEALSDEGAWEIHVFRKREEAREWIAQHVKKRWNITDLALD